MPSEKIRWAADHSGPKFPETFSLQPVTPWCCSLLQALCARHRDGVQEVSRG